MNKKCPKCAGIMVKGCCIKCGYMSNGNVVGTYKLDDKFEELRIYDDHFDEMYRNDNQLITFFLGPLNFSYRNDPIIGGVASALNIYLFFVVSNLLNPVSKINSFLYLLFHVFYIIIVRVAYCTFVNRIILKIDSIKIKIIKNKTKDKDKFYHILNSHNDQSIGAIFLSILISICIFLVFLIIRINQNS